MKKKIKLAITQIYIYIYIYIHGGLAAAKCHGTLDVTRKCQVFKPS